jgi:hypothetical protein
MQHAIVIAATTVAAEGAPDFPPGFDPNIPGSADGPLLVEAASIPIEDEVGPVPDGRPPGSPNVTMADGES